MLVPGTGSQRICSSIFGGAKVFRFGENTPGIVLAIGISSVLFGIAHTEQGLIGVAVTMLDAVFFSMLKRMYQGNLWAPILAHGFSNTLGLVTFFFTGPLTGLW